MANNDVLEEGRRRYCAVEAGTISGSPVIVGSRAGVAQTDRDAANSASVDFGGDYRLTVTGAVVDGTPIYYTANANPLLRLNIVATALFYGYATEINAGGGAKLVNVHVSTASGISTLAAGSLEGTTVANVADGNLIGGIPVLHRIAVADAATGDTDYVITQKEFIVNAWLLKTANASSADANTMQLQDGAGAAITNAMAMNAMPDQTVTNFGTIDDAKALIAAGGTLRIHRVRAVAGGQIGCTIFVLAYRSA